MEEPRLYIGLDTQDVEWNLVCGTPVETIWTGSVPAYDVEAFRAAVESARIQCGFTSKGYKAVALFEDIPWEDSIWIFLDEIGMEAHILDPTGVPADLDELPDDEGLYKAPALFELLIRYFGWGDKTALRTLPPDHAFAEDLEYLRKERTLLRKEYRQHLHRICSLISHAGCNVPKEVNTCAFSALIRRDGKKIERHFLARLERHRARAELVADQHAVVEDEFLDHRHAHAEALHQPPIAYQDEPIDMKKASRKVKEMPNPKRLRQSTPMEVLYPALRDERKKIAREMAHHRDCIRDWVRRLGGDPLPDLLEQDPATWRNGDGDRFPRALVMLLRREQERFALADEQHAEVSRQIACCAEKHSRGVSTGSGT